MGEDLVVVVPGILGSRLRRGEDTLWGVRRGATSLTRLGRTLTENLTLGPDAYSNPAHGCDDGITADALMRSAIRFPPASFTAALPDRLAAMIPGFWTLLGGYELLEARLRRAFAGTDVALFPYDWRQSNRVTARRLHDFVTPWMEERRRRNPEAGLLFVCHSMGGLVARYFAECLDDQRYTKRVVTIGTPYQGAVKALGVLANGRAQLSAGPSRVSVEIGELLRSWPAVAELLPTYPCLGESRDRLSMIGVDGEVPGLPRGLREHGLGFHRELETTIAANGADRPVYSAILGRRQPTAHWASPTAAGVETHMEFGGSLGGDGTVTRESAIPPEWEDRAAGSFVNARHGALHDASGSWEQVLGLLTGAAPRRAMGAGTVLVAEADDYVAPGGAWKVTVTTDQEAAPGPALVADVAGGGTARTVALRSDGEALAATLAIAEPDLYRWQIRADDAGNDLVEPISDLFICAAP